MEESSKTKITDNQKAILQLENYNICRIFNNNNQGVFVGLFSGMGIDVFMNKGYSSNQIFFIVFCIISIILMMISMGINSRYDTKCKQKIRELLYAEDAKTKTVKNKVKYKKCYYISYYLTFFLSIISLCYGLTILKSENSSILDNTSNSYRPNNSIKDSTAANNLHTEKDSILILNSNIRTLSKK